MVDGLYDLRKNLVLELAEKKGITLKYLPEPNKKYYGWCSASNECLKHCEGEYVVHFEDYTFMNPNSLEKHWNLWQNNEYLGVQGVRHNCDFPEWIGQPNMLMMDKIITLPDFCTDYDLSISIFKKPIEEIDYKSLLVKEDTRWKERGLPETSIGILPPFSTIVYSNMGLPLDVFLELNGYDESFDRGDKGPFKVGADPEMSTRAELMGVRFFVDQRNEWWHLDHHKAFASTWESDKYKHYQRKMNRTFEVYQSLTKNVLQALNSADLREERNKILGEKK